MFVLGDLHGAVNLHKKILRKAQVYGVETVCLGDICPPNLDYGYMDNYIRSNLDYTIIGNHDNPNSLLKRMNVVKSYAKWELSNGIKIFLLSGASSINRNLIIKTNDYWNPLEELCLLELDKAFCEYKNYKPDVLIAHEASSFAIDHLHLDEDNIFNLGLKIKSLTTQCLDQMISHHKPKLCINGHWHRQDSINIDGTTYISVGYREVISIIQEDILTNKDSVRYDFFYD